MQHMTDILIMITKQEPHTMHVYLQLSLYFSANYQVSCSLYTYPRISPYQKYFSAVIKELFQLYSEVAKLLRKCTPFDLVNWSRDVCLGLIK